MSPLTKDHLAELREELEAQLARLMRSIEASEAALEPVELDQSRVGRLSRMDELQNQSLTRNLRISEVADHGKVRVTLTDGEQESIYDPWVEAGSLRGHQHIETLAFPLTRVAGLESHSTNEVETALAVLEGLVAVILVAACAESDTPNYGCPF